MQLRQPEPFGVLDHHDACLRHVDADLDHRRRHQDARRAVGEPRHRPILVGAAHLAVHQRDRIAEALAQHRIAFLGGGEVGGFGFLDQRADPIDAPAVVERAADRVDHFAKAARAAACGCRSSAGRPAFRAAPTRPCRRNRSAPACAGSASRSAPEDRPPRLCAPAPAADARRSGAARRRRPAPDRGTPRRLETARGCRR